MRFFRNAALIAAGGMILLGACATAESIEQSSGDCVALGCQRASETSTFTTVPCVVDHACKISWRTDIFEGILDQPASGCTAVGQCHGDGHGGLTLVSGRPHDAYAALAGYVLLPTPGPVKKYLSPCDPAGSGLLCNNKLAGGETNPYGQCGALMPLTGTNLTMAQLKKMADWIACGAPEN